MISTHKGLTEEEVLKSREEHGLNLLTPPKQTPWYILYLEKFKDPIIVILLVATAISLGFGIIEGNFVESIGIIIAILIVIFAGLLLVIANALFLGNSGELTQGEKTILVCAIDESESRPGMGACDMCFIVTLDNGTLKNYTAVFLRHLLWL